MSLPPSAHTSQPWRIHALAPDFALEDVWALPTPGGPDDFPRLAELVSGLDPGGSRAAGALFALRSFLGRVLRWDRPEAGIGARVPTLRDRLPDDLRKTWPAPRLAGFSPVYVLDDELALENANRTMHGVVHLGWVPDGHGAFRGQLAILVKRNGALGAAYMAAIRPFRHLIVYPSIMRRLERDWHR
jgi:hypothetical protein